MNKLFATLSIALGTTLVVGCAPMTAPPPPQDSGRTDSGTTPVDSGTPAADSGTTPTDSATAPSLPSPFEWSSSDVTYTLSGGNLATPQGGTGMMFLAPAGFGQPDNARMLTFSWDGYLGAPSSAMNCHFGVLWNEATRQYSFSAVPELTQRCTITGMGEADSTLDFTGATVSLAPVFNNLIVRVSVTGTGPRFSGMGTLEIAGPPR
jgi:hypothetical protein